ncbi:MAG: hypothetical protein DCC49_12495 [Acidobacteria bacterium]|nr:MAG: hypothetical protein DCC49_12495 [Acidobacteriota bacterium]
MAAPMELSLCSLCCVLASAALLGSDGVTIERVIRWVIRTLCLVCEVPNYSGNVSAIAVILNHETPFILRRASRS